MVIQIFFQQDVSEGVDQRHVAAVIELQMAIGDAGGFDTTRVADDDFCPVFAGLNHPAGDDWVGVGAVIAKDQQAF